MIVELSHYFGGAKIYVSFLNKMGNDHMTFAYLGS